MNISLLFHRELELSYYHIQSYLLRVGPIFSRFTLPSPKILLPYAIQVVQQGHRRVLYYHTQT
nr:hypothetical protein Iba_chr10dCG9170 [Ipomoea batatas]